jgi:hypothetical protein
MTRGISRLRLVGALVLVIASSGCRKESAPAAVGSALASAVASAPPPKPKPWYQGKWSGKYTAALQPIEPLPGTVREWKLDDGGAASGSGTLELELDERGVASGKAQGPLGALAVNGNVDEETVRLTLEPGAPAGDKDFRGVLVARREGAVLRGTLRASSGDSLTVRVAEVELARVEP